MKWDEQRKKIKKLISQTICRNKPLIKFNYAPVTMFIDFSKAFSHVDHSVVVINLP